MRRLCGDAKTETKSTAKINIVIYYSFWHEVLRNWKFWQLGSLPSFSRTRGMAPYVAPHIKGESSCVSRSAAVRDIIGVPHIDLIGSTS